MGNSVRNFFWGYHMVKQIGQSYATRTTLHFVHKHQNEQNKVQESLVSGKNITSMRDNSHNYLIASQLTQTLSKTTAANENMVLTQGFLNTIDSTLQHIFDNLQEMNRHAIQASTGTNTAETYVVLNNAFEKIKEQINTAAQTRWAESQIFNSGVTTASILDIPTNAVYGHSGYVYGQLDPYSVKMNDMGNTKNVSFNIGDRHFEGSASLTDTSITLFDTLDPQASITLSNIDFTDSLMAKVAIQSVGFNKTIVPFQSMTKTQATALVTNIKPSPNNAGGDYSISYKVEGDVAIITNQNQHYKSVTRLSIPELVEKFSMPSNQFSGALILDDGTQITLNNVDLYKNTLNHNLEYFSYNVVDGYSKKLGVQICEKPDALFQMEFPILTTDGLSLPYVYVSSQEEARIALDAVQDAIKIVSLLQGDVGSWYRQLEKNILNFDQLNISLKDNRSTLTENNMESNISETQRLSMMIELSMSLLHEILQEENKEIDFALKLQNYR
ncbi:MAG: hypothetical protein CNLJKLNK_01388 [Holosporales bacterium]